MAPSVYPSTAVPGHLKEFLGKARTLGKPSKVTREWLASVGFKGSSDATMIRPMAFVGLTDNAGVPTALWDAIRVGDPGSRSEFAASIRIAYADLFSTYPDAHRRDTEALLNYFRTKLSGGQTQLQRAVSTFQVFCAAAAFGDSESAQSEEGGEGEEARATKRIDTDASHRTPTISVEDPTRALTVNINIQLQLPPSTEPAVYDEFFRALRRNLLDRGPQ